MAYPFLAKAASIKNTVFAVDNPAGPKEYQIAKEADVTVLLYKKHKVEVNHTFAKGEFTSQAGALTNGDVCAEFSVRRDKHAVGAGGPVP